MTIDYQAFAEKFVEALEDLDHKLGPAMQDEIVQFRHQQAQARIEHGSTTRRENGDGWQPIETAPEEEDIFIWNPAWECAWIGKWTSYPDNPVEIDSTTSGYMSGWLLRSDWHCVTGANENGWLGWDDDPKPTHWMLLPKGPNPQTPLDQTTLK